MSYLEAHPRSELPPGLVQPVRVDPSGKTGPTRGRAAGPSWRRCNQGYYVPAGVRDTPEQRILEASVVIPERAALTGWAGLRWLGGTWFSGLDHAGRQERPVVVVTADANVRSRDGVVISQERLSLAEHLFATGLPVTWPERSACFEARYARDLIDATVAWDMAAFSDLVSLEEAWAYALSHPGWTGIPQARRSLTLASENSWSPMETRLRLIWVLEAGRPTPSCNLPIFDRGGRHIGTPDLLDVEHGVIGEYDGALHLEGSRRARDLVREQVFRNHGLEYFTVLGNDMRVAGRVVERIESAFGRARPVAESRRTWTTTPPTWWRGTGSVRERRDLARLGLGHLLPNRPRAA